VDLLLQIRALRDGVCENCRKRARIHERTRGWVASSLLCLLVTTGLRS
jgi:hypothetical protein